MTEATTADERTTEGQGGFGSLGSILGLLVLTWAAALASRPLNDNSFFTHLATGRLILEDGTVPTADPYTFTAAGEPWTVQSWLASVAYAGFERMAGTLGLRLLLLLVYLAAAWLLWRLTGPAPSLLVRLGLLAGALLVATGLWTERPYMVGVIGISLVWLALEDELPWWALLPTMWVWGNSHGSFVLAPALVALVMAGGALDRGRSWRDVPRHERLVAAGVVLGAALAAAGPLGVRVLTFPLVATRRTEVFQQVTEWQAPDFRSSSELAFLVFATSGLLLLARLRVAWRYGLPTAAFVGASLYAQRNIVVATVVLVVVLARVLPAMGTLRAADRPPLARPLGALVAALFALIVANTLLTPAEATGDYASRALAWADATDLDSDRMATDVLNGNLLEVLDGATGTVFVDDRFDMLPDEFFRDYLVLERSSSRWEEVLDDHRIDAVLWSRSEGLASLVASSDEWRVAFSDPAWIVATRRPG